MNGRPPTQAVILAGGRGSRLGELTTDRPKPMIGFHGRPFLEYLIEMLRDQGIERVLLLLGYLPDVIQDHFGDGSRLGIRIEYSVTGQHDLTGHRLKVARPLLDSSFLLMYCDNYWPLQLDRLWKRFREADLDALVTVYSNAYGHSKDNVSVAGDGRVRVFDRTRSAAGLRGVEIGYAIVSEHVLDLLPEEDALFEAAVYPALAERERLGAFVTGHRYYSVGSPERLPLTEVFLARRNAIILDRDGVLNRRRPRAEYVRSWNEFEWLPGATEALRLLRGADYTVIVVSNQAGVARGAMTEADLAEIHDRLRNETLEAGGRIDAIYSCPHGWGDGCDCRKPKPGMLFRAQHDFDLDLSRTLFVGDDERDVEAGEAAGCRPVLVSDERSLLDISRNLLLTDSSRS
jgi:histidinol-phosphate phosphatase family protein